MPCQSNGNQSLFFARKRQGETGIVSGIPIAVREEYDAAFFTNKYLAS